MVSGTCRSTTRLDSEHGSKPDIYREDLRLGMLGLMASGVAHDLNNILQIIAGNLDLVSREIEPGSPAKARLASALSGVERGAKLTARVLDHCRCRTQEVEILDVGSEAMGATLYEMLSAAIGPGVALEIDLPRDMWLIRANTAQFETALLNLALNARDAMAGRGTLSVHGANCRGTGRQLGDEVLISVIDDGPGMDDHTLENLFTPFFSTKGAGQGTGLGLAIVRQFVEVAAGSIRVASSCGGGTSFFLTFPRYL